MKKDKTIPIVPALLTDSKQQFNKMLEACTSFADLVQIDIMDGVFVPSTSIGPQDIESASTSIKSEAHLMVADPLSWLKPFKSLGTERIIYHFEIDTDHTKIIESIRSEGFRVGIAVNPPTSIEEFEKFVGLIDSVLFMSVNPGFYGAPFIPEVLDKIRAFKGKYPDKLTGIDGGVKLDNVCAVADSGVDYICVGSAILKAKDPSLAHKQISEKVNG